MVGQTNGTRGYGKRIQFRGFVVCFGEWVGRNHGELTYQVTQLITGHGWFRGYTHRIGKADSDRCSFCETAGEDNVHVLVECEKWREERDKLTHMRDRSGRDDGGESIQMEGGIGVCQRSHG